MSPLEAAVTTLVLGVLFPVAATASDPVLVLAVLLCAVGYGTWAVLQEVQRVQFVPVNQTPGVTAEVATLPTAAETQRDNVVALNPTRPKPPANLDQLYRPQELALPEMVARDSPISTIDAGSVGAYADRQAPIVPRVAEVEPPRVVAEGPPPVDIVALKPSWVRIYFDDGSVLFEQTLDAGQSYRIPPGVEGAQLRTCTSSGRRSPTPRWARSTSPRPPTLPACAVFTPPTTSR